MQPTPSTAFITVLASAAGSLTAYYTPALIPGLILGVIAYLGVVLGLARAFRLGLDQALVGTTRCLLLAIAVTLHATHKGCIAGLAACAALLTALARWDTSAISRTGA